ncbi:MAG: UDP-N-acetylmuramate--L-alanine ligase [Clostridia bacterium]|nr:UDP-N-acetylmuramate--L-alanine ligase [Clostridia bacterium]
MSALSQMLKSRGFYVQGSDLSINDEVKKLTKKGIKVFSKHSADNLKNIDIIVYSSSIHSDNKELIFAKNNNLVILKRAELLGIIASEYKNLIAIAGSHGKTTASAMISEMFIKAGLKPTIHIGGRDRLIKSNYKVGNKKFFITEACEYMDNYHYLEPDVSVILNIDNDHLDYFKTKENLINSFKKFAQNSKNGGVIICNNDDVNTENIRIYENLLTFGLSKNSDIYANYIKEYLPCKYKFNAVFCGCKLGEIKLNILGKHNIYNALVCVLIGLVFDIYFSIIKDSLENFSGTERRCEIIGEINGGLVIHDYAHHPKQIEKMIDVAKEYVKKSGGEIYTVFEPHTYSRTKDLFNEFSSCFNGSDYVYLLPVYSAREDEKMGYNFLKLAEGVKKYNKNVENFTSFEDVKINLKCKIKKGDIVLILGAGSIEKLAKSLKC